MDQRLHLLVVVTFSSEFFRLTLGIFIFLHNSSSELNTHWHEINMCPQLKWNAINILDRNPNPVTTCIGRKAYGIIYYGILQSHFQLKCSMWIDPSVQNRFRLLRNPYREPMASQSNVTNCFVRQQSGDLDIFGHTARLISKPVNAHALWSTNRGCQLPANPMLFIQITSNGVRKGNSFLHETLNQMSQQGRAVSIV